MISIINIVFALMLLIAAGWYCYSWGQANGAAEGYTSGYQEGIRDCLRRLKLLVRARS